MSSTLFPGYKLVSSFSTDEDAYESEEEVSYVTLDLGTVEPMLVPSTSEYRLIGLDSPTPFLQLSGTVFKGEHSSLLGSEMLFAQNSSLPSQPGPRTTDEMEPHAITSATTLAAPHHHNRLHFLATTSKRIRFREVQLKPKEQVEETSAETLSHNENGGTGGAGPPKGKGKRKGKARETGSAIRARTKKMRKGDSMSKADAGTSDVALEASGRVSGEEGDPMNLDQG